MCQLTQALNVFRLFVIAIFLAGCQSHLERVKQPTLNEGENSRSFKVLHINDVYRLDGINNGTLGGLARVRAIRAELERNGEEVLFLHGGDMLFPSAMSDEFNGIQMIDTLNVMDGVAGAYDQRMFAVFGNHEFDKSTLSDVAVLEDAVNQSDFRWLNSNIDFSGSEQLRSSSNIVDSQITEINGVKVGLFGLSTNIKTPDFAQISSDYVEIARLKTKSLRNSGAEVIIALTHLTLEDDRKILALESEGPDIVFGGHEHHRILERIGNRYIVKADADALSAALTKIDLSSGVIDVDVTYRELDSQVTPDSLVQKSVSGWQARYKNIRCIRKGQEKGCKASVLAKVPVDLIGTEQKIRRFETNLGNWLLGLALMEFADSGAQVAFLNSGSFRLNQNILAGSSFEQKHLDALLPYSSELVLIEITGAELEKIVDHSVEGWAGNGWWLQIAGFAYEHTPSTINAERLMFISEDGLIPVKTEQKIKAVTSRFLLDPETGQDGYTILGEFHIRSAPNNGIELKTIVQRELLKGPKFQAKVPGRICNREFLTPCIFDNSLPTQD